MEQTNLNQEEMNKKFREIFPTKNEAKAVKLDDNYYMIDVQELDDILLGEHPLNRVFVPVTPLLMQYATVVKWPLFKPRVVFSEEKRSYFFQRFARVVYKAISTNDTHLQSHIIKKAVELDDVLMYTFKEGIVARLLDEYETMFLIRD